MYVRVHIFPYLVMLVLINFFGFVALTMFHVAWNLPIFVAYIWFFVGLMVNSYLAIRASRHQVVK